MKQLLDYFRRSLNGRSAVHQGVRMARIYCRGEKHYVATSSQTREGFWVEESPASVLKLEDTAGLNQALRSALKRSRRGISLPKNFAAQPSPTLKAAWYKRFSAFAKGAAFVSIEEKAGIIKITPSENRGNDGFHGIALLALEIPADSPDLVPAIQIAFDRCR